MRDPFLLAAPRARGAAPLARLVVVFGLLAPYVARAAPQLNVGITPGVNWRPDAKVAFDGAVVTDLLFGRTGDTSFGLGPRLELGTRSFDDLRLGAGISAQLPTDPVAVVGSVQGMLQSNAGVFHPGLGARCFVGLRPYNHYGFYSAAVGLSVGADHFPSAELTNVVAAIHLDGMWLSLPFLWLLNTATR